MMYGHMPLYPRLGNPCGDDACVRVPLFGDGCRPPQALPPVAELKRVPLENPCCPGEWAEVLLGVDACGNLALCVRRDEGCHRAPCPPPDRPPCPPPRTRCRRGRLYGNWDR